MPLYYYFLIILSHRFVILNRNVIFSLTPCISVLGVNCIGDAVLIARLDISLGIENREKEHAGNRRIAVIGYAYLHCLIKRVIV